MSEWLVWSCLQNFLTGMVEIILVYLYLRFSTHQVIQACVDVLRSRYLLVMSQDHIRLLSSLFRWYLNQHLTCAHDAKWPSANRNSYGICFLHINF
jgi:hypothetical protein